MPLFVAPFSITIWGKSTLLSTDDKVNDLYDRMSEVAKDISLQIISNTEGACSNLRGLSVSKIALTPTASVFGGFFGWILDITLE